MDSVEEIALRIAQSAAYDYAVEGRHFEDANRGVPIPIDTREEFKKHVLEVLRSEETLCFAEADMEGRQRADVFYHPETNTLIILPEDPRFAPIITRPMHRQEQFDFMVEVERHCTGNQQVTVRNSIYELHPELRAAQQPTRGQRQVAEEEQKQLRHQEDDKKLRIIIDRRFDSFRQDAVDRYAENSLRTDDEIGDSIRHAKELRSIEERRAQEFKRYMAERVVGRRIKDEIEKQKADKELRAALEKQFEKEHKALLDQHTRELHQSSSPAVTAQRHAKELKALEDRRQKDFERHKRERETRERLRKEHEDRERREELQRQLGGPQKGSRFVR